MGKTVLGVGVIWVMLCALLSMAQQYVAAFAVFVVFLPVFIFWGMNSVEKR